LIVKCFCCNSCIYGSRSQNNASPNACGQSTNAAIQSIRLRSVLCRAIVS
jgi:hypothetical protein